MKYERWEEMSPQKKFQVARWESNATKQDFKNIVKYLVMLIEEDECPSCQGNKNQLQTPLKNMNNDWKRAIWEIDKLETMIDYFYSSKTPYDGTVVDLCRDEIERIKIEHSSNCSYCESIEKATSASPRKKYLYCPMCGRERKKKWRD